MLETITTTLLTGKTMVAPAISDKTRRVGLWSTNPNFWLIEPDFDQVVRLRTNLYRVRKGDLFGLYDVGRRSWIVPVRFAGIQLDKRGNLWIRRPHERFKTIHEIN